MKSFDLETHLIQPGLPAPPIVCGSMAERGSDGKLRGRLLSKPEAIQFYRDHLGRTVLVGANIQFDNLCMAHECPELVGAIFDAYERGMFKDVLLRQALNAVGQGHMTKMGLVDPRTGAVIKGGRYKLELVTSLMLGRDDAKANDVYRKKYATLENAPMAEWPPEARQYPVDDAVNTLEAAEAQDGASGYGQHVWGEDNCCEYCGEEISFSGNTKFCGFGPVSPLMNLHNEPLQLRAAWAGTLASARGLRTDPPAVEAVSERVEATFATSMATYKQVGLRRDDDSENTAVLARMVADAYGDKEACEACGGTGKALSAKQPVRDTTPRNYINCKVCCASGRKLVHSPRTEKNGIRCDRDTLQESGDELLEKYSLVSMDEKFIGTYLPYLRRATVVPMNPSFNVLVATGRTSYDGLIQLIPRGGGLRECFVPRPGHVYCSIDYAALELSTLAQCTTWVVGWSNMADSINRGLDLHTKFAASMIGTSYEELIKLVDAKDKVAKGYRQAAKAANFGFPGGMGAAKLVLTQRKQGLRFCITLGQAPVCHCGGRDASCRTCHGRGAVCGAEKIREWKGRPTPPLCKRCVELAEDLRNAWLREWPEIRVYFQRVGTAVERTGKLTQFVSNRVRAGLDFNNGCNTLFQGLAADGAKNALWKVSKECYTQPSSAMFGARPVIFVHDEIFSEIPCEIAADAAERMTEVMVASMKEYVPDVKVSAEPTLMTRWFKEASCVRADGKKGRPKVAPGYGSADGELMVWMPDGNHVRAGDLTHAAVIQ